MNKKLILIGDVHDNMPDVLYSIKTYDIKDIAKTTIDCWNSIKDNPEQARKDSRKIALKHFSMKDKVKNEYIPLYNKVIK